MSYNLNFKQKRLKKTASKLGDKNLFNSIKFVSYLTILLKIYFDCKRLSNEKYCIGIFNSDSIKNHYIFHNFTFLTSFIKHKQN